MLPKTRETSSKRVCTILTQVSENLDSKKGTIFQILQFVCILFLFLESQAPTDMNRYYTEQLCHMECNSTAKLTCLRDRKRVAPRLATRFS